MRIRGLPPLASELQFIDRARILAAQQRQVVAHADDPLIAGFDPSGGGSAWNGVRFLRDMDSILDRLVHGAHRIELQGDSIRKLKGRNGKKGE